jgi:hypothetical protein
MESQGKKLVGRPRYRRDITLRVNRCISVGVVTRLFSRKHIYFHVIHNINKTHNIKGYNLMVLGYMFRPHCGHFRANLYRLSTLNVRTIWDPIVGTSMT